MVLSRRRAARAVLAVAGATCIAFAVTPADAVPLSPWPAGGYTPTTCASETPSGSGAGQTWTYTDTDTPEVQWAGLHNGRIIVIGPAGRGIRFSAWTAQFCSGAASAAVAISVNGAPSASVGPMSALFDDPFGATWLSTLRTAMPSQAGRYVATATTQHRYDSFVLDVDHKLVSKVDAAIAPVAVGGPWTSVAQFVLRQTTLTSAVSRSVVPRGGSLTVSGYLNYAQDRAWARDNGGRVTVLTRSPGQPWVARTIRLADAGGRVSWTFTPTAARTLVYLTHSPTYTGRYTAGSSSPVRTVVMR